MRSPHSASGSAGPRASAPRPLGAVCGACDWRRAPATGPPFHMQERGTARHSRETKLSLSLWPPGPTRPGLAGALTLSTFQSADRRTVLSTLRNVSSPRPERATCQARAPTMAAGSMLSVDKGMRRNRFRLFLHHAHRRCPCLHGPRSCRLPPREFFYPPSRLPLRMRQVGVHPCPVRTTDGFWAPPPPSDLLQPEQPDQGSYVQHQPPWIYCSHPG